MQRTLLIVLATAVVAAGIATGATILLSDNDDIAISSPPVTSAAVPTSPQATTSVTTTTASPSATAGVSPGSSPASSPRRTSAAAVRSPQATQAAPGPTMRPLRSIDCSDEPVFCGDKTGEMTVTNDRLTDISATDNKTNYSGRPTIRITSKALQPDDRTAGTGDNVKMLHVDVVVRNDTNRTFVFPQRVVGLDVYRNGRIDERLDTEGEGFEMPPGGEMRAKFDKPVVKDGDYRWEAKTWHYAKS